MCIFWVCLQMTFIECCTDWPVHRRSSLQRMAFMSKWIELNWTASLWIRISVSTPATEPHWTPLASDAEGFSSFVLRRRSALRFGDGRRVFWVAYLCWDWSRAPGPAPAPAPSTAIRLRPPAFSWPGTSEASPDCFTACCLESQSESGWFPYLWREEDTPVL